MFGTKAHSFTCLWCVPPGFRLVAGKSANDDQKNGHEGGMKKDAKSTSKTKLHAFAPVGHKLMDEWVDVEMKHGI